MNMLKTEISGNRILGHVITLVHICIQRMASPCFQLPRYAVWESGSQACCRMHAGLHIQQDRRGQRLSVIDPMPS